MLLFLPTPRPWVMFFGTSLPEIKASTWEMRCGFLWNFGDLIPKEPAEDYPSKSCLILLEYTVLGDAMFLLFGFCIWDPSLPSRLFVTRYGILGILSSHGSSQTQAHYHPWFWRSAKEAWKPSRISSLKLLNPPGNSQGWGILLWSTGNYDIS